jgi:hypothetical protein
MVQGQIHYFVDFIGVRQIDYTNNSKTRPIKKVVVSVVWMHLVIIFKKFSVQYFYLTITSIRIYY